MASLTATAQNAVIDALMRNQPLVLPAIFYIALVTTSGPSNALAGVEVVGGAYARVAVPSSLANWSGTQSDGSTGVSIGSSATSSNNNTITYPVPTAGWGSVVGYEFWDQPVNGNRWLYDVLLVPKTISAGDGAPTFPPGTLRISFV